MGCVYVLKGNDASEVELFLASPDTTTTVTRTADASARPYNVSGAADQLFRSGHKGPRADAYAAPGTVTAEGKQLITASVAAAPGIARAVTAVTRDAKTDRLRPTESEVARGPGNALLMTASYASPFNANFQVDAFLPTPDEIAYRPTSEALNFRYQGESQAEFEERERRCLATAIYFEARGEPERGQIAVGQVILNRVRSPLFPETICGVVYQGQMRKGCQFSFTCDGNSDTPRDNAQWALANKLTREIMTGKKWLPEVGYSTFYHANYVRPRWANSMNKIDKIGRHVFYKKRNEEPYVVEALVEPEEGTAKDDEDTGYLLPTLSLASAVSAVSAVTGSVTDSVTAVAGTTAPSTPVMSLGYAGSE